MHTEAIVIAFGMDSALLRKWQTRWTVSEPLCMQLYKNRFWSRSINGDAVDCKSAA